MHISTSTSIRYSSSARPLRVSTSWLLWIYATIPAAMLVVAVDTLLLDRHLLHAWLPHSPSGWAFWTLVFGMPHIVASLVIMADGEYLRSYYPRLSSSLVMIAAAIVLVPWLFGDKVFLILLALSTIYHVLSQQFGISLMLLRRRPDRLFQAWRWISTLSATVIYLLVFNGMLQSEQAFYGVPLASMIEAGVTLLILATIPLVYQLSKGSPSPLATWYLLANLMMMLSTTLCWVLGYSVFVILIPRVIHDITAFTVYMVHDHNRNADRPRNALYRLLSLTRLPAVIVTPLAAIGISWLLFNFAGGLGFELFGEWIVPASFLLYLCTFMHYYMEGWIWKGNSLLRQSVPFAHL